MRQSFLASARAYGLSRLARRAGIGASETPRPRGPFAGRAPFRRGAFSDGERLSRSKQLRDKSYRDAAPPHCFGNSGKPTKKAKECSKGSAAGSGRH